MNKRAQESAKDRQEGGEQNRLDLVLCGIAVGKSAAEDKVNLLHIWFSNFTAKLFLLASQLHWHVSM
jgi:hypothetical protein